MRNLAAFRISLVVATLVAVLLLVVSLFGTAPLHAQKEKREPLTLAEQDQVAEAGIDPVARVGLYVKFLDEHSDTIKGLITRAHTTARIQRLNGELAGLRRPRRRA